jgi:hypothetical protein
MGYKFLGAHANWSANNLPDLIKEWKPPLITVLDHSDVWHDVKTASPNTIIVGRVVFERQLNFNDPNMVVAREVEKHLSEVLPIAIRMGNAYDYWQGENEPVIESEEAMRRYEDFEILRAYTLAEMGFRTATGSFSVGTPRLSYWTNFLEALYATMELGGVLALHEYGWPTLDTDSPWYLLRHRKVYFGNEEGDDKWEGLPYDLRQLPLAITEGGFDGLLAGDEPRGWRTLYKDNYAECHSQLEWYDNELGEDPYVLGSALYCYDCHDGWESYNYLPDMAQEIADNATPIYRLLAPPPIVACTDAVPPKPAVAEPIVPSWLPDEVAGRKINTRGVHLLPFGHHTHWMQRADYWVNLLLDMGISWVVIITEGDSVLQEVNGESPISLFLRNGIIPLIRDKLRFPENFKNMTTVERTVDMYGEYGLRPPWILYNEPFDEREWRKDQPPYEQAWAIIADRWMNAASIVVRLGGVAGFPDGPSYPDNPFERIIDARWIFDEGLGFYTGHHYGKGRPLDYPYDTVSQFGYEYCNPVGQMWMPLTEKSYSAYLDDYADDPKWREESVETINSQRYKLIEFGKTAIDDDTCWRGWEKIGYWSVQSLGYVVPMAMTEGGWVPRDRAGTGPNTDIRWPHTTPNMVAKKTLSMFEAPSPFFAICPWLLADDAMLPDYVGWPFDSWVGWAYKERYGYKKPVVQMLIDHPPTVFVGNPSKPDPDPDPEPCPELDETIEKLTETKAKTESALEELREID